MEKKICAICGKEFEGYGNSPFGAIDHHTLKPIQFDDNAVCCDECNMSEVITGRIAMMKAHKIIDLLEFEDAETGLDQLRSLETEETITPAEYDFVVANWDLLTN